MNMIDNMNTLYCAVKNALETHQQQIVINACCTKDDVRMAIRKVMRDNSFIFWFAHQYEYDVRSNHINFRYSFSKQRADLIKLDIEDVVYNDFKIEYVRTLSVEMQAMYVYKWLVGYCNYNIYSAFNQSIYSVFIKRNSVCTGYSKAAQYLFQLLGIESMLVFGHLNNTNASSRHCWNVVEIYDKYYHMDICFADPNLTSILYSTGISDIKLVEGIVYNFFCVSTEQIAINRTIEDVDTIPLCNSCLSHEKAKSLQVSAYREGCINGVRMAYVGATSNVYLSTIDKHSIVKIVKDEYSHLVDAEKEYFFKLKECKHILRLNEGLSTNNTLVIEQATSLLDLLCSRYYKLTLRDLIEFALSMLNALKECQDRNIYYRDIHPCNIYLAKDGIYKLGDLANCSEYCVRHTDKVGSTWYMSPETINHGHYDISSSMYSLTMVVYFILNRMRPPFFSIDSDPQNAIIRRASGEVIHVPQELNLDERGDLYIFINEWITKGLANSIQDRFGSLNDYEIFLNSAFATLVNDDLLAIIYSNGDGNCVLSDAFNLEYEINSLNSDKSINSIDYEQSCNTSCPDIINIDFGCSCMNSCASEGVLSDIIGDGVFDDVENFCNTVGGIFLNNEDCESICSSVFLDYNMFSTPNSITTKPEINYLPEIQNIKDSIKIVTRVRRTKSMMNYFRRAESSYQDKVEILQQINSAIYAPAEVKAGDYMIVQVYLYLNEESGEVELKARMVDKDTVIRNYTPLNIKLKDGDKVDIVLNFYSERMAKQQPKYIVWQGKFTSCEFAVEVPKDINIETLLGQVLIVVNKLPVGEMMFKTTIVHRKPCSLYTEVNAHVFKKIFISYAHQDSSSVKFMARMCEAQGVSYFFDRHKLKAGDVFDEEIFKNIDSSDLFILCWSQNAAKSEYVAKERARALSLAYPQKQRGEDTIKIYPISIEPRASLPSDMSGIYNFEEI